MNEYKLVRHFVQKCTNPPEQVFFKRFEFKESVTCVDGGTLDITIDWEAGTASAQAVRPGNVNPLVERKGRLGYYKQNLLDLSYGGLHYEGKRLLDKWTFEIEKLEYILSDGEVKHD